MFKKKIFRSHSSCSLPVVLPIVSTSVRLDDEHKSLYSETTYLDVTDPANYPVYPDVDEYNDLGAILASGLTPSRVNTCVIHDSSVSELENLIEDSNILNTSNNEN